MRVWIVIEYTGYEDTNIIGVFYRSAKAHEFKKEKEAEKNYFTSYDVEKWEVK